MEDSVGHKLDREECGTQIGQGWMERTWRTGWGGEDMEDSVGHK